MHLGVVLCAALKKMKLNTFPLYWISVFIPLMMLLFFAFVFVLISCFACDPIAVNWKMCHGPGYFVSTSSSSSLNMH